MTRLLILIFFALPILALSGCAAPQTQPEQSTSLPQSADFAGAEDTYILDEGDAIAIQVFDEPDLTLETVVGANGSINYSYLGDVRVSGKSPSELEDHITGLLQNGYLVNPSVNVRVTNHRPFFINGEVGSPGRYAYQPGLTMGQAIALAGGLTDRASARRIKVKRTVDRREQEFRADLDFKIQPGDTITINEGFF